jgi:hypothetical protein
MDFKNIVSKVTETAGSLGNVAAGAADSMLTELNDAIPIIHALGLDVRDLHMELGLPPEVSMKLIGKVENINVPMLHTLIAQNADKKALVTMLKALEMAYNFKAQLKDLHLEGIEIDLTLGLIPKVHVGFVNQASGVAAAGV